MLNSAGNTAEFKRNEKRTPMEDTFHSIYKTHDVVTIFLYLPCTCHTACQYDKVPSRHLVQVQ